MPTELPSNSTSAADLRITEALQRTVAKLTNELQKQSRVIQSVHKQWIEQHKTMTRFVSEQNKSFAAIQRNTRALTDQSRTIRNLGSSFAGLGSSITRVVGSVSALGIAFKALGQIKAITESRVNLAVSGGIASLKQLSSFNGKLAPASRAQMMDAFLRQGVPQLAIGRQPEAMQGLMKLQESLGGLGSEIASELTLDLTKSFGNDFKRLQGFLSAANRDPEQAIRQFQSQGNIAETIRALNAITVQQSDTSDPIVELQKSLVDANEKLKTELEKLYTTVSSDLVPLLKDMLPSIKSFAEIIGGLSTGEVVGGLAALTLGPSALRLGGRGLLQGAKLAGRGYAGTGVAGGIGTGVASGMVLSAPLIAGAQLYDDSLTATSEQLQKQLDTQNPLIAKLLDQAKRYEQTGDLLRAKRTQLDAQMLNISPASKQLNVGSFGYVQNAEFTPEQQKQIAKLSEQRKRIQDQIDGIVDVVKQNELVVETTKEMNKAVETATAEVQKFAQKIDKVEVAQPDALLQKVLSREVMNLDLERERGETDLRKLELQYAQSNPFGLLAAGPQLKTVNDALSKENAILEQILSTIDMSTVQGIIDSNKVKAAILGNRVEQRNNLKSLKDAFLSQALGEASGAGRYEKIIFTMDRNLRQALKNGVFNPPPELKGILGNIDPSVVPMQPRTAMQVLQDNGLSLDMPSITRTSGTAINMQSNDKNYLLKRAGEALIKASEIKEQPSGEMLEVSKRYNRLGTINPG